ncbi:hypothetical protein MC885_011902 [Smutsia gigantea]|nr:hypothetical protein MC885_011902 [Smutsia gigantea]
MGPSLRAWWANVSRDGVWLSWRTCRLLAFPRSSPLPPHPPVSPFLQTFGCSVLGCKHWSSRRCKQAGEWSRSDGSEGRREGERAVAKKVSLAPPPPVPPSLAKPSPCN